MSNKRTEVVLTHRPNDDGEMYQVAVRIDVVSPDSLDEARKQAAKGMHDLVADLREQYGETVRETS